jgi:excisionase family DNA binding protein
MNDLPKMALSVDEAAAQWGCSPAHIRRLVKAGTLNVVPHMGRRVLIPTAELERTFGVAS